MNGLAYVVKIIHPKNEVELDVYAMAAHEPNLREHILPCNMIRSESHPPLLVMSYIAPLGAEGFTFFAFTDFFYQVLKVRSTSSTHVMG